MKRNYKHNVKRSIQSDWLFGIIYLFIFKNSFPLMLVRWTGSSSHSVRALAHLELTFIPLRLFLSSQHKQIDFFIRKSTVTIIYSLFNVWMPSQILISAPDKY